MKFHNLATRNTRWINQQSPTGRKEIGVWLVIVKEMNIVYFIVYLLLIYVLDISVTNLASSAELLEMTFMRNL